MNKPNKDNYEEEKSENDNSEKETSETIHF